jgi:hypothetical protein
VVQLSVPASYPFRNGEQPSVVKRYLCVSVDHFRFILSQEDSTEDFEKGSVSKSKEGKEAPNEDIEADLQVSASAFEALERDFQEV